MTSGMSFDGAPELWGTSSDWAPDYEYETEPESGDSSIPVHRFDIQTLFWRFIAAGTSNTPAQVLEVLSTDERMHIRRRVAENASTAVGTLVKLSTDPAEAVRLGVARNRRTPVHVLRKLAYDESVDVRYAIAENPEVPDAILLSLFLDPDPCVADRASQTLAA